MNQIEEGPMHVMIKSSALRTFVIVIALIPAWHLMAMDTYSGSVGRVLQLVPRFNKTRTLPYPSIPIEFKATAYCDDGITKSGLPAAQGIVAGDPDVLPLGTWIYVEVSGYSGIYQVMDTGRLIKGRSIDIFIPDLDQAIRFGNQQVSVTVLKYAPFQRIPLVSAD